MADKLWETQGNSYVETAELYKKLKKQFKNFLGNEFKLSAFLEGRNKLIPIIVKTRNGFVFWMNSSDNPKEGILMIFWEMPSVKFRTEQMLKRYANRFYDCFLKGSDESFWSVETSSENDNAHIFEVRNEAQKNNYDMVSRNISILGNNDRFIDEKGLLWKGCKLDDNWFFVAAKTNFNKYNNYHTYFLYFMILLGIEEADNSEDIDWLCKKIIGLRVFDDEEGVMNKSIMDIQGEILVVSQFTLMASYKKGNRPSYIRAAGHSTAIPLYEEFCNKLSNQLGNEVKTGEFGADMKVDLLNDGPVTICMDTKNKE